MGARVKNFRFAYSLVEMLVTFLVVALMVATGGVFIAKLLTIREREREEAYIREKLVDICGLFADDMSIGSFFCVSNGELIVKFRCETGGVSLETGRVSHVAQLASFMNATNNLLYMNATVFERGELVTNLFHSINGNAMLLPVVGDMVNISLFPLNDAQGSGAALGYLQVAARYKSEDSDGEIVTNTATSERLVRLWNRE